MDPRAELTVQEFLRRAPHGVELMARHGLGKFQEPEVVESLGSVLKLRSALTAAGVDVTSFLAAVDSAGATLAGGVDPELDFGDDYANQKSLRMLGLLPCGMKMPFKRRFEAFLDGLDVEPKPRCLVEGNVNHELSYYPYVDTLTDPDELPEVIVSSDINAFFHHGFVGAEAFESYPMRSDNSSFAGTTYPDPLGRFTMLSANLLVLVVNRRCLGDLPIPRSWADLMAPIYENTVTMRGQDDFFCSGVLLPMLAQHGESGIRAMAQSVLRGLHPAQMVKEIEQGKSGGPFYIMPLFFAQRLKDPTRFEIIFPDEGAIVSPVFLLVKRGRRDDARTLAEFITGRELGQFCADAGFPSLRGDVDNHLPSQCKLWWMGWEFLRAEDPRVMKQRVTGIFSQKFRSLLR